MRVLVFSGAQAPLPVRYPYPAKPKLSLPPLVHRSLHTALDAQPPSALVDSGLLIIPHPSALTKHSSSDDHEVTIKVQITGGDPSTYLSSIQEAIHELANRKGLSTIDTALIGLPKDTDVAVWEQIWKSVTSQPGPVKQWGTLDIRQPLLSHLTEIKPPYANELNVTDCQKLPRELTSFAESKNIPLWASGGGFGPDPLPAADFHNLLHEFNVKAAAIAPAASTPALAELVPVTPDGETYDPAAKPGVSVRWVLSYTLLSQARNIVQDKGFIISAELL